MSKAAKRSKKAGQPTKYRQALIQEAEQVCQQLGYTDKQLAQHFKVSTGTIGNWKRTYPEFAEAVRRGKYSFDTEVVEEHLLKRAKGFYYDEETWGTNDAGKAVLKKIVRKYVPPDTTAIIFWLKNRHPERWGDRRDTAHSDEVIVNVINYVKSG